MLQVEAEVACAFHKVNDTEETDVKKVTVKVVLI